MKVLDLQCAQGHGFEGWFASEDDFQRQIDSGFLTCPLCGEARITRLLSAPRLNLRGGSGPDSSVEKSTDAASNAETQPSAAAPVTESAAVGVPAALQAAWLHMVRRVLAHTENVGERFAEEARRIHYGETPERGIRGKASPAETEALLAEGIAVLPLPIPEGMDGPVQ
ncbi:MAG: DUF1178 family protein [Burkholderiaceae bacterium]|jgi:hypothetical protein|nr:DUF1178 family protein [Burkholderiaceae bacterium]